MDYRVESDSLGPMQIPANVLWGPQTQRSLLNFPIGTETMPRAAILALARIKAAAALVNQKLGRISSEQCDCIQTVCQELLDGKWQDQFPLSVWQTGSGTQTNMNVNEVIARRGNQLAGQSLLHPNDHVNCSQSSNDTFPTAMHLAILETVHHQLLPALRQMIETLQNKEEEAGSLLKIGRTHLQDAVPMLFAQEISGWRSLFEHNIQQIEATLDGLYEIALGGTAVGTGLNAPTGFAEAVAEELARATGFPIRTASNKMHALSSKDEIAFAHGALRALACNLMKFANDLRWLASGPRCGLGELQLPENEPGSSIMPGKVNPTQCEAATMVAVRVMGNDTTIQVAASQGNFELNVFLPVLLYSFLQSATLLTDALNSLRERCVVGMRPLSQQMERNVSRSLMLATALNPHIGYEKAAQAARHAHLKGCTLKEAVLELGLLTEAEYDQLIRPETMVGSPAATSPGNCK